MPSKLKTGFLPAVVLLFAGHAAHAIDTDRPEVQAFVDRMVEEHSYDRDKLLDVLSGAESKQSILDAISRPAERTLEWHEYRNIFMKPERISAGAEFWQEHEAELERIRMFTQKGQYTRRILDALGEGELRDAVIELERADSPALGTLRRYRDVLRGQVRDLVEQQYLLHAEGRNDAFMDEVLSRTRLANVDRRHVDRVREQVAAAAVRCSDEALEP